MLVIFATRDILLSLLSFGHERLTSRQKSIIVSIQNSITNPTPVTRAVKILSAQLKSSESSLWLNLKQLKKIGLIEFGNHKTKGEPVRLTPIGKWLAANLGGDGKNDM